MSKLWARFRRWGHCLIHFHKSIIIDSGWVDGVRYEYLGCHDCGFMFWERTQHREVKEVEHE